MDDLYKYWHDWFTIRAELNGKPVVVDVDSVNDGSVDVTGEFPPRWTHGGWTEVTHKRVAISALQNMQKVKQT